MEHARIAGLLAPFAGELRETQLSQISAYLDLLQRWNARMNLTAVRDAEEMVTRHFGESLFAARRLYPEPGAQDWGLIDIGSGAGFPGLPIKIYRPELRVNLLESNQRKATFLREVVRALKLPAVEVLAMRAEVFAAEIGNRKSALADGVTVTLRAVERFEQIAPTALRILENASARARRLALLIGAAQVQAARTMGESLTWAEPLPVPQSMRRVLLVGNVDPLRR